MRRITDKISVHKKVYKLRVISFGCADARCLLKQRCVTAYTVINAWGFSVPVFPGYKTEKNSIISSPDTDNNNWDRF